MRELLRIACFTVACLTMLLASGCATPDPELESDMPWNMPQSWEGAPSIPGMNQ